MNIETEAYVLTTDCRQWSCYEYTFDLPAPTTPKALKCNCLTNPKEKYINSIILNLLFPMVAWN